MLPRKLYELLPYLYILTGIVSTALIDSTVVLMSSMLLIVTGVFVLLMRRNFRGSLNDRVRASQITTETAVTDNYVQRSSVERRCCCVTVWPVLDDTGDKIPADRRKGERRMSTV